MQFPKNFYFGAATSAHQVEGFNTNDWTQWERDHARLLARQAESTFGHLAIWKDIKTLAQHPQNYISGKAADHYRRFKEDFDIAARLGHNAHRFSIEWARVEPEEGKFNNGEIERYQRVVMALRERKLEPFITLWHFTLPQWFAKKGGFLNANAPRIFSRYCERVMNALGGMAKLFITMNEPEIYAAKSYWEGAWPPQNTSIPKYFRIHRMLVQTHNAAYNAIKKIAPSCVVGVAKNNMWFKGISAPLSRWWWNHHLLKKMRFDCIGINYYFGGCHSRTKSDMGWPICPEGLSRVLKELRRYHKPVYITENGIADKEDITRADFIKAHLNETLNAIEAGIDVRGYFYWSLLDNFEWDKGFWPRFGLVEVDYATMERRIRPSAWEYARLIKTAQQ